MDNRYYEPDMTEFCIGFKYEVLVGGEWAERIFSINDSVSTLINNEVWKRNIIRVKKLSAEDILNIKLNNDTYMFTTTSNDDNDIRFEYKIDISNKLIVNLSLISDTVKMIISGTKEHQILLNSIKCNNLHEFLHYLKRYNFM